MSERSSDTTEPACAARDRLEVELHAAHEVIKQLRAQLAKIAHTPFCEDNQKAMIMKDWAASALERYP